MTSSILKPSACCLLATFLVPTAAFGDGKDDAQVFGTQAVPDQIADVLPHRVAVPQVMIIGKQGVAEAQVSRPWCDKVHQSMAAYRTKRRFAQAQWFISLGPRVCDSHAHEPGKNPPVETSPFASHGRASLETRAPSTQRPVQKSAVVFDTQWAEKLVSKNIKYMLRADFDGGMLFDLKADPFEKTDVITNPAQKETLAEMRGHFAELKAASL